MKQILTQKRIEANRKNSKLGGAAYSKKMADIKFSKIGEYNKNPKLCFLCKNKIPYDKRNNKFCSRACSATYNNSKRDYESTKLTWKNKVKTPKISKKLQPSGPYSKLFQCNCSHCKVKFYYRTQKKYCVNCEQLYSHDGRAKYWFTFNIFHYPELFDLSLITTYGFRDNKTNPNGITRDHKISVNDAIRYNYDPYYIKHPMNCELMLFNENNKKKTNSSITYEHLIELVDNYDNR